MALKIFKFLRDVKNVWFDWHSGFHKEEDRLLKEYYKNADIVMSKMGCLGSAARKGQDNDGKQNIKPGIVMKLDGRTVHGGLSDRLRGICAVYEFCKNENIPFYLSFTYPMRLEDYLEPNEYDWRIAPDDVIDDALVAQPVYMTLGVFASRKFQWPYLRRRLKLDNVKQWHVYSNTTSADKRFNILFNEMFRPAPRLQKSVDDAIASIGGDYVGCSFRFLRLLGDFNEKGDFKELPPVEREALINKCIAKVEEMKDLLLCNGAKYILVTSDSVTFTEAISKGRDYIRTIPGKVVHIDYTADASYEVYEKIFLDMLVLSHAKSITLFKTGDMYMSGFAHRAALIGGVKFDEVIF